MKFRALIAFVAIFAAQHVGAAELFPNDSPRQFALADKLEADSTIGGYAIWSGEGKWRFSDLELTTSTGGPDPIPLGAARFFQTESKSLVAAMEVRSNLRIGNGFWTGEPCKRDDMLFKLQLASGREDNCLTINHIASYMSNPGGKAAETYAFLKEQGIDIPPTVIAITVTRNASSLRRLVYTLWVNPEMAGFARETEPNWGRNPWNKTMSFNDPAKKQFIDQLIVWSKKFQTSVDLALNRKQDPYQGITSWRSGVEIATKPEAAKAKVILD
jgi:hypothetical protein